MTRLLALIATMLATGCASAPEPHAIPVIENLLATGFPELPRDARQVAERLASCSHFGGEINGDGSDRDKEVFAAMTQLRCDTIDQDVSLVRHRYSGNRVVQEALDAASRL